MKPAKGDAKVNFQKEILKHIKKDASGRAIGMITTLIKKDRREKFFKWVKNQNPEERRIKLKAFEFQDKYFQDMTLKEYAEELTAVESDGEIYIDDFSQDPPASIKRWRIRIKIKLDFDGLCNSKDQVIEIKKEKGHKNLILLHEMIHAYEDMLSEEAEVYKQYIILRLHQKLLPKIPDLMNLITRDCHRDQAVHSILFLLKSLDLDLRLKKPLGTVYAYGRKKDFTPWKIGNQNKKNRKCV